MRSVDRIVYDSIRCQAIRFPTFIRGRGSITDMGDESFKCLSCGHQRLPHIKMQWTFEITNKYDILSATNTYTFSSSLKCTKVAGGKGFNPDPAGELPRLICRHNVGHRWTRLLSSAINTLHCIKNGLSLISCTTRMFMKWGRHLAKQSCIKNSSW